MAKDQPKLAMKRPKTAPRASTTVAAPAIDAKLKAELSSLASSMRGPVFSLRIWDDLQHVRKELVLKAMEAERRDDRAKSQGSRATARATASASVETADAAPQNATKRLSTNAISPEELNMQRDLCCYYLGAIGMWKSAHALTLKEAIVSLAYRLELIGERRARSLWCQVSKIPFAQIPGSLVIPIWNKDQRELWFDGRCVRRVATTRSTEIEKLLDAFAAVGWRSPIEHQPEPNGRKLTTVADVRAALSDLTKSLNRGLNGIAFGVRGTKVFWMPGD